LSGHSRSGESGNLCLPKRTSSEALIPSGNAKLGQPLLAKKFLAMAIKPPAPNQKNTPRKIS